MSMQVGAMSCLLHNFQFSHRTVAAMFTAVLNFPLDQGQKRQTEHLRDRTVAASRTARRMCIGVILVYAVFVAIPPLWTRFTYLSPLLKLLNCLATLKIVEAVREKSSSIASDLRTSSLLFRRVTLKASGRVHSSSETGNGAASDVKSTAQRSAEGASSQG